MLLSPGTVLAIVLSRFVSPLLRHLTPYFANQYVVNRGNRLLLVAFVRLLSHRISDTTPEICGLPCHTYASTSFKHHVLLSQPNHAFHTTCMPRTLGTRFSRRCRSQFGESNQLLRIRVPRGTLKGESNATRAYERVDQATGRSSPPHALQNAEAAELTRSLT